MPKYTLTYFDSRGRAEVARFIFALAGQEYEDKRLTSEQWQAQKKEIDPPFGQLPMLEVDGFKLCQSGAIYRFLGKRFDLMGSTDEEEARINMVMDCTEDMGMAMMKMMFGDDAAKAAAKKNWEEKQFGEFLGKFEKLLDANNRNKGSRGVFVGNSVTVADLAFVNLLTYIEMAGHTDWKDFPRVGALSKLVQQETGPIENWIKKRPVTQM